MERFGLSTLEGIKAYLKGPKFGPRPDSEFSLLKTRSSALKFEILSISEFKDEQEIARFESRLQALGAKSLELRLGAACEHGGDKGPKCERCRGQLKGPHVKFDPGMDVIDYCLKQLNLKKGIEMVQLQLDNIGETLADVDGQVKSLHKVIAGKRRSFELRQGKLKRPLQSEVIETSVEKIKGEDIVLRIKRSHEILEAEDLTRKCIIYVRVDRLLEIKLDVSLGDLLADYSALNVKDCFAWFKSKIAEECEALRGRTFDFASIRSLSDSTLIIEDAETLLDAMRNHLDSIRHVELTQARVLTISSPWKCYERELKSLEKQNRKRAPKHIEETLKRFDRSSEMLRFIHVNDPIPKIAFDCIAYAAHLKRLEISFCEFDFLHFATVAFSLTNIEELVFIGNKVAHIADGLEVMNDSNDVFPRLKVLVLQGENVFNIGRIREQQDLLRQVETFLSSRTCLLELDMSRTFHVPFGAALGDDDIEFRTSLLTSVAKSLPLSLKAFRFNSNTFLDIASATCLIALSLQRLTNLEELSLSHCRLWSQFEQDFEDDNESPPASLARAFIDLSTELNDDRANLMLKKLFLTGTHIGTDGARALGQCLRMPSSRIQELRVANSGIELEQACELLALPIESWSVNPMNGVVRST